MMEAGLIGLRVAPIAQGFWKEAKAKIDSQNAPKAEMRIAANTAEAAAELRQFRMRERANAVNLRVKVDEQSLRRSNRDAIKYIEHTWKQSDFKRMIRVQVYVAGATALPALAQGIVSVTTAITELSRVTLALPGLLSGVVAAAGTMATGINGVADALKASNDGMQKSSQFARQYAQSARALENAQRDVVKALKDANRELQDQKEKLAQGQLSVESAQLAVQRANQRLFEGGFKSFLDYQEALLGVKQANLDLSIAVKQAGRDVEDYYENASKGAQGSNTYKDALDKLANSLDNYRKAQFQAAGMSEQFISAMKQLAPAGQDFVLQLLKIRGAWKGLESSVQTTLFAGLGDSIEKLAQKQLPMLKTGMQKVAGSINADFKSLFNTLGSAKNTDAISKIFERTGAAIAAAQPGINSLVNSFLHLSEVGARFLPRLALAFDHVMGKFESFIDKADKDGSLERWIDSGLKVTASLGRSLLQIGSILSSVSKAYEKATGNTGGFAATMERSLTKLADYLASPRGQGAMMSWIRQSQDFMKSIKESLPGIRQLFGAIGDAAREFALHIFPVFSWLGKFANSNFGLVKLGLEWIMLSRTVAPAVNLIKKSFVSFTKGIETYRTAMKDAAANTAVAYQRVLDAKTAQYRASERIFDQRQMSRDAQAQWEASRRIRASALQELQVAQKAAADAKAAMNNAGGKTGTRKSLYGLSPKTSNDPASEAYIKARDAEKKALKDFDKAEQQHLKDSVARARVQQSVQGSLANNYGALRMAQKGVIEAEANLAKAAKESSAYNGWIGRMRRGIGAKGGGGLIGALGGIVGAMSTITSAIGGIGAIGAIYAFDQYTAAMDRSRAASDALKASQDALSQTLSKGTGSATAATLEENARQLRDRVNPVHADDPNQNFDAAKILQRQMGIQLSEAVQLALPTEYKRREARLAPADAKIIAAVPNLQEWKTWGNQYRANGVDESVYGKALNGDQDSIGKVEAARKAIKDANPLGRGVNMGIAANTGLAPNDLGAAQEQLGGTREKDGNVTGLRGLSLATGALRGVGSAATAAGQNEYEGSKVIPQRGLNKRGKRAFAPFVLGPHQVLNADMSATIEVDRYPDDVIKGWVEGARANGISVERRYPNGAVITIDSQHGPQYFEGYGYARGGSVWGAGTATSDSIPAMLSNGEFVINARSASIIGHDKLAQMNRISGYKEGGLIGPGIEGNNKYYIPAAPMALDPQTLPEAIGQPTAPRPLFGTGSVSIIPNTRVGKTPDTLPGMLGSFSLGTGIGADINPGPKGSGSTRPVYTYPVDSSPYSYPLDHGKGSIPGPGGDTSKPGVTPAGGPVISSGPLVSAPVAPTAGSTPGAGPSMPSGGLGGPLGGGSDYVPMWGGNGALADSISGPGRIGTDASRSATARINPNANILDYLVQVANAAGLRAGSGPAIGIAGSDAIAQRLGIPLHNDDGGQHSINRALDIGSAEQAQSGQISNFVRAWMADPEKVAATRQLIFQDPKTGEVFAIHHGVAYTGQEAWNIYGADFAQHTDHAHIALEGVPLNAFVPGSLPTSINQPLKLPGEPGGPPVPPPPAGPAVDAPPPAAGPANNLPTGFDPISILKQIGMAILNGIFAFFGIDGSGLVSALFGIGGPGDAGGKKVEDIPQPDQAIVDNLEQTAAQYEAQGDPDMAKTIRQAKDNYLKQFAVANVSQGMAGAADYFDSIGDKATADRIRANQAQLNQPQAPLPPNAGLDAYKNGKLPSLSSGNWTAPPANYSGGTPEVHSAVYRAFKEAGFGDDQWPALVELLNHENDTWDPTRPTGGPNSDARGIFQFLSTTWGTVGMQPSDDPYIQSVAGMRYIKQRYGSPTGAWAAWQSQRDNYGRNWYSIGGLVRMLSGGGMARKGPFEPTDPWDFIANFEEQNYGPLTLWSGPGEHFYLSDTMDNARGGYIQGPGTGTSDSIPAMLSNGEFVMRAAAVDHLGVDRLQAMNDKPQHFARGGLVRGYDSGGLVGGSGDGSIRIQTPEQQAADQARALEQAQQQKAEILYAFGVKSKMQQAAEILGAFGKGPLAPPRSEAAWSSGGSGGGDQEFLGGGGNFGVVNTSPRRGRFGPPIKPPTSIDINNAKLSEMSSLGYWLPDSGPVHDAITNGLGRLLPGASVLSSIPGLPKNPIQRVGAAVADFGMDMPVIPDFAGDYAVYTNPDAPLFAQTLALGNTALFFLPAAGKVAGAAGRGISAIGSAIEREAFTRAMTKGIEFNLDGAGLLTKREIKRTIADLRAFSPEADLSSVSLVDPAKLPPSSLSKSLSSAYAVAGMDDHAITLNSNYWGRRNRGLTEFNYQNRDVKQGFHNPTGDKSALASTLAHEYGHILDFTVGGSFSSNDIFAAIHLAFMKENPAFSWMMRPGSVLTNKADWEGMSAAYSDYIVNNLGLSSYSFRTSEIVDEARMALMRGESEYGSHIKLLHAINRTEAWPEAYADIFTNGNRASKGSKLLWAAFGKSYKDVPGREVSGYKLSGPAASRSRLRQPRFTRDKRLIDKFLKGEGVQLDLKGAYPAEQAEIKRAIAELMTIRNTVIGHVGISPDDIGGLAYAQYADDSIMMNGLLFGEHRQDKRDFLLDLMGIDDPKARKSAKTPTLNQVWDSMSASGWGPSRGNKSAIFSLLAHEYIHHLDSQTGHLLELPNIWDYLERSFLMSSKNPDYANYPGFLLDNLSLYSFGADNGRIFNNIINQAPNGRDIIKSLNLDPAEMGFKMDRGELIADAISDVIINGRNAKLGSRTIFDPFARKVNAFDPNWPIDRNLARLDPLPASKPAPEKGRLAPPRVSTKKGISADGRARTWPGFAAWAKTIWPKSVESAKFDQNIDMLGMPHPSGDIPDLPFDLDVFETLREYSGSSSVNKTLRGMENLRNRSRLLSELIGVRPLLSGPGGELQNVRPLPRGLLSDFAGNPIGKIETPTQDLVDQLIWLRNQNQDASMQEIIRMVVSDSKRMFPGGASQRQVWEAAFIEVLRGNKRASARAKSNLESIDAIDRAFEESARIPSDIWVTRMIEDFGNGPVEDASQLIGVPNFNPGYTSTAGGIAYRPEKSRDWWKGVFGERPIMQQILVPGGTKAVWFGGSENELLLPRNILFTPHGSQTFQELLGPQAARYYDEASKIYEERTGEIIKPQFKIWGSAEFPDNGYIPNIGLDQSIKQLRELSVKDSGGVPRWMKLLSSDIGENAVPWSDFRIGRYGALGFASGGAVRGPGGPKSDMIPAMLSSGEYVMNAEAVKRWGLGMMDAMNFADGGLVPLMPPLAPPPPPPPDTPPPPTGSADPDAFKDLTDIKFDPSKIDTKSLIGSALAPKGGGGGVSAGARAPKPKDPRAALMPAPTSDMHVNPALAAGIKGAFSTVGALAGTAASIGLAPMGGGAGAGAGAAAASLIGAGAAMAGDIAVGAVNILSSLGVGTVTPAETGQGYGAPLLPQQNPGPAVNNFQSIHNGNVVTNNLNEYSRLKDRKDAQKSAPFFNRVNH